MNEKDLLKRFWCWLSFNVRENWIVNGSLVLSATQTYALFAHIAPRFFWLPFAAIALIEGGVKYWQWREYEADAADGSIGDTSKNAQETIANAMVWATVGTSIVTMFGGLFAEIASADVLAIVADETLSNWAALISVGFVFVLLAAHIVADWQYRSSDPEVIVEREFRQREAATKARERRAELLGRSEIANKKIEHYERMIAANKDNLGRDQAAQSFQKSYALEVDGDGNPTQQGKALPPKKN
jgi:hypothetical protein